MVKQSPAIINTGHPKINTQVDASCNVLCVVSHICFLAIVNHFVQISCVCVKCVVFYNTPSADTTGEDPSGKS